MLRRGFLGWLIGGAVWPAKAAQSRWLKATQTPSVRREMRRFFRFIPGGIEEVRIQDLRVGDGFHIGDEYGPTWLVIGAPMETGRGWHVLARHCLEEFREYQTQKAG